MNRPRWLTIYLFIIILLAVNAVSLSAPQPGDIFREYKWNGPWQNASKWQRCTDPNATHSGAQAFLPNPINTIVIDDLQGVVKIEVLVERLQSHAGTHEKRIKINDNSWIDIPEADQIASNPECYMTMTYPSFEIPISHFNTGTNTFEFTNSGQKCHSFGWGQFIINGVTFRVYYSPSKPHPTGSITSPTPGSTIYDNPTITATASGPNIVQVDFIGDYEDWNYEGDGIWKQWHYNYYRGQIQKHIGSDMTNPYSVTWNTDWLPDQNEPFRLMARIVDDTGMCYMTDEVNNITFERSQGYVKLYQCYDIPQKWSTRIGNTQSCHLDIPDLIANADAAQMFMSTWNGYTADEIGINDNVIVGHIGLDHHLSYDIFNVPLNYLTEGQNAPYTYASTEHHGIEVLWPGMPVKFKWNSNYFYPVQAYYPEPGDGQTNVDTVALNWTSGKNHLGIDANSHNLYLGTDFNDINNGTIPTALLDTNSYVPSGPFLPDTTYYWRVDQNYIGDVNSPYKGEVWSFKTASIPVIASNPYPQDGQDNIDTIELSWIPGQIYLGVDANSHDLYLGTSFDEVNDGTIPLTQLTDTYYIPDGVIKPAATYYWRIDQNYIGDFNSPHKGDVWSFTTADHFYIEDFDSYENSTELMQNWSDGSENQTGALISLETSKGQSGQQSLFVFYDNKNEQLTNKYSETSYLLDEFVRDFTEDHLNIRKFYIWFYGDPVNSIYGIDPMYVAFDDGINTSVIYYDGDANDITKAQWQRWTIDIDDINGIDLSDVNAVHIGMGQRGSTTPGGWGFMRFDTIRLYTYLCTKDNVHSFEDFDSYTDESDLKNTWIDGATNSTGGFIYLEQNPPVQNQKAMKFSYYQFLMPLKYSETSRIFSSSYQDWYNSADFEVLTENHCLYFWFYGQQNNNIEPMYIALDDGVNPVSTVYHDDPNVLLDEQWQLWELKLSEFNGINLSYLQTFYFGVGERGSMVSSSNYGNVYIDDIQFLAPTMIADLNKDCIVDTKDIKAMADEWLQTTNLQTDLYKDNNINAKDFAYIAARWLEDHRWLP